MKDLIRKLLRLKEKTPVKPHAPQSSADPRSERIPRQSGIRLSQLRRNEAMVAEVLRVLNSPGGVLLMDVLQNESLSNFATPGGMAPHDLIKHLGQCEGYRIALNNIRAMTLPLDEAKIVTETYGVDEQAPYPPRPSR